MAAAAKLDDAGIAKLESDLPKRNSAPKRAILLTYVATHAETTANQAMRVRQLSWLIENEPTADILTTTAALIPKEADPNGYASVRQLWLNRLQRDPVDRDLMEGATNFLKLSDPDTVHQILDPLRRPHAFTLWSGSVRCTDSQPLAHGPCTCRRAPSNGGCRTADGCQILGRKKSRLLRGTLLPQLLPAFTTMNQRSAIARTLFPATGRVRGVLLTGPCKDSGAETKLHPDLSVPIPGVDSNAAGRDERIHHETSSPKLSPFAREAKIRARYFSLQSLAGTGRSLT